MARYDDIEDAVVDLIQKSGGTLTVDMAHCHILKAHPTWYREYVDERRRLVPSERERKADAAAERTAKALARPTIPTPFGPFGRILNELVAHEITQKRAKSPADAIMLLRSQYPDVVGRADAEAWDYAAGRGE